MVAQLLLSDAGEGQDRAAPEVVKQANHGNARACGHIDKHASGKMGSAAPHSVSCLKRPLKRRQWHMLACAAMLAY